MFLTNTEPLSEAIELLRSLGGRYPQMLAFNAAAREQVLGLVVSDLALAYARLGDVRKTGEFAREAFIHTGQNWLHLFAPHYELAVTLAQKGMYEEGWVILEEFVEASENDLTDPGSSL